MNDGDKIRKVIAEEIPAKVAADNACQNAQRVVMDLLADHADVQQFSDNPSFRKWPADTILTTT